MKTGLILIAILVGANVFAKDAKKDAKLQAITATCNLADLSNKDNPNILTDQFNVLLGQTVEIASYNGHAYEMAAFDVSYNNNTRFELLLSSRDVETKTVVGSSLVIFKTEIPDLTYQEGPNVLLNCSQLD